MLTIEYSSVKHSALRQEHRKAWNLQISLHVPNVFVTHKSVGLNWGLCTQGALSFCGYSRTLKTQFAQDCVPQWHFSNKISLNTLPVCKLFITIQRTAVGLSQPYCKHVHYWCNKSTHTRPLWLSLITIYAIFYKRSKYSSPLKHYELSADHTQWDELYSGYKKSTPLGWNCRFLWC